ncbi:hypothetical protein ACFCWG_08650 [Streptomyces sp. NPDC056390]|uniref:hypothetical protein n=1 Tax=Streptomyces sp. NPDC056390 TaxID=3345806 RepID=UPI0035E1BCA2
MKRIYILVFVDHETRSLHLVGATARPTGGSVTQQTRNLAAELDTRMQELEFLIRDRDKKFTAYFDSVFEAEDVEILKSPPRANAVSERLVGTLRRELFNHVLIYNEAHALALLREYAENYLFERYRVTRTCRPG